MRNKFRRKREKNNNLQKGDDLQKGNILTSIVKSLRNCGLDSDCRTNRRNLQLVEKITKAVKAIFKVVPHCSYQKQGLVNKTIHIMDVPVSFIAYFERLRRNTSP